MMTRRILTEPEERIRDIEMMTHPGRWPIWPRLPLKRSGDWGSDDDLMGCLVEERLGEPIRPTVYLGVVFGELDPERKKEYASFEELLDDGWMVD